MPRSPILKQPLERKRRKTKNSKKILRGFFKIKCKHSKRLKMLIRPNHKEILICFINRLQILRRRTTPFNSNSIELRGRRLWLLREPSKQRSQPLADQLQEARVR